MGVQLAVHGRVVAVVSVHLAPRRVRVGHIMRPRMSMAKCLVRRVDRERVSRGHGLLVAGSSGRYLAVNWSLQGSQHPMPERTITARAHRVIGGEWGSSEGCGSEAEAASVTMFRIATTLHGISGVRTGSLAVWERFPLRGYGGRGISTNVALTRCG